MQRDRVYLPRPAAYELSGVDVRLNVEEGASGQLGTFSTGSERVAAVREVVEVEGELSCDCRAWGGYIKRDNYTYIEEITTHTQGG